MSTPDGSIEAPRRGRKKNDTTESVEPEETSGAAEAMEAMEASVTETTTPSAIETSATETAAPSSPSSSGDVPAISERRRIEEQLQALEKKQAELRRALAIADHPGLAEAIRTIEGRAYAVARAEAKMAEGLSKAEERKRETLAKKLETARTKRDELDAQIAELEAELAPLGEERTRALAADRRDALTKLMHALGANEAAFHGASLDVATLVPEVARYMPEVVKLAEELVAAR